MRRIGAGLLCTVLGWLFAGCGQPVSVTTTSGVVNGRTLAGVSKFLGIPYAAPPVGGLRFRPPVEPAPWSQPLEATKVGPSCPQEKGFGSGETFSEDCLTLNVFTTQPGGAVKTPVMVFIHGGSFTAGTGGAESYDGAYVAKKGAVVVTINYRLGPLGFLAHPALIAEDANQSAGNYGILDQQLALRWVQNNIARFGGDPKNVTLFGESAGAGSVCVHMISPLAKGLFHRAISESGTCIGVPMPLNDSGAPNSESAVALGRRVSTALGCETAADVAACLRGKSSFALLTAAPPPPGFNASVARYGPNLDGLVIPKGGFLALQSGMYTRVPFIAGVNQDEGTLFGLPLKAKDRAEFDSIVRALFPVHNAEVLSLYPAARYPNAQDALVALISDGAVCLLRQTAKLVAASEPKTFLYYFSRVNFLGALTGLGATHGMELPYVFHNFNFPIVETQEDAALSDAMIGYYTRFAATGDPNGGGAVPWPAVTANSDYLELNTTIRSDTRLRSTPCDQMEQWTQNP